MLSSENHSNDPTPLPDSVTSDRQTPEDVDAIFECLASHRRRLLIESLSETSGPVVVEESVQTMSEQGNRRTPRTLRGDRLVEITIALLHTYLPKMDEAGVVDHEAKTVQEGDRFCTAESLLEVI
ncbi:DUF7344 domain-containing protein [Halomicrococcus sp. SG-WS-1]|uniref:DUF7344 domain-containing protein n=1 Tax=Halomicrococcus sp. SG-WS-1 TaxID=3439057 RepID=UPI003F79C10C